MVAPSLETLASAIDSTNNKWDFVSRTKYAAFERQVRNTLSQYDQWEVIQNDEPTQDDIKVLHTSVTEPTQLAELLATALKNYRVADMAAYAHIDKLLTWKAAPARLTEMSKIETTLGRPSGRALWQFIQRCRDKSSYQDQKRLKAELASKTVPVGCNEEKLRTVLNDIYALWVLIKGNDESEPDDLFNIALSALPSDGKTPNSRPM